MRIPTISLAVFAVCFGLPGFANGRSLPSSQSDNFLLVVSEQRFFNIQYSSKDENIPIIGEEDFTNTSLSENWYNDMTFNCANNNIYLLKSDMSSDFIAGRYTLDVINFDENNRLKTVAHVQDIFDHARSIALDWTTGKIYWTVSSKNQFSMKVIDESFKKIEYIIQPYYPESSLTNYQLLVYPKQNELFFSIDFELWYTSNSPNSSASLLFEGEKNLFIDDFAIDYATDKLYVVKKVGDYYILECIDIGTSVRPLNANDLNEIEMIPHFFSNLEAFNNKIYWTILKDGVKLYLKNGNNKAVEVTNLTGNSESSFVSSSCPSSTAEKREEKKL